MHYANLTLPVLNVEAETVFYQVSLTKTEFENKKRLDLLESILCTKVCLQQQQNITLTSTVPEDVLQKMTANNSGTRGIYNKLIEHQDESGTVAIVAFEHGILIC